MAKVAQRARPDPRDQEIAFLKEQLERANTQLRSVASVTRTRGMVDSGDLAGTQNGDVLMPSVGKAVLVEPDIVIPDGPPNKAKLDELAFMDEMVEVQVHESGDQRYPDPCISVWNDGRHQLFVRGVKVVCKRKFVEVLARAKPESFGSVEYVDPDGIRAVKYPKRVANKYPFTVTRDDNPRGTAWLQKILAEA